jgi:hypothetical protein
MTNQILKKKKLKMKKDALEYVDFETEKKNDPKYKTELCKSYIETQFCPYGNKCRFAHGKHELSEKNEKVNKYKLKICSNFKEHGYCLYGARCNFIHDQREFKNLERSFYTFNLLVKEKGLAENSHDISCTKRLNAFQKIKLTENINESSVIGHSYYQDNFNCTFNNKCFDTIDYNRIPYNNIYLFST